MDIEWDVSIPLFDTHGHLDLEEFTGDREEIWSGFSKNDQNKLINIGFNEKTCINTMLLTRVYSNIYAAVGMHPHDASSFNEGWFEHLTAWLREDKTIAVGEIGLDFYRNLSPQDVQLKAFKAQLDFARGLNLPVILHCRDAGYNMSSVLKASPHWGILHCFQGDEELLDTGLKQDYYISIAGNVTYKNSPLPNIIRMVPWDRLLVETDCPYLAPLPYRGMRNEPMMLTLVIKKIQEILELSLEEVSYMLYKNAVNFLNQALESKKALSL